MISNSLIRLGDICRKIGSGATPSGGANAYKTEGISLIRSQNVLNYSFDKSGLAFIDELQANKLNNVTVECGDILINITGDSVARVCLVPDHVLPARVNQHVCIIRTDNKITQRFLFYYLQYIKPNLLQMASFGATRNALTKEMISNIELELPEEKIQKNIVNILDIINDKIQLNSKISDNLDDIALAVLKNILNEASSKNIKQLQEICNIKYGKNLPTTRLKENGYYVFGGNGVIGYNDKYLYEKPQVLVSCRGAASGKVVISYPFSFVTNNSLVLETEDDNLFQYLQLYCRNNSFEEYATGSAQPQITIENVKKAEIILPDIDTIKKISEIVSPIFKKRYQLLKENEKLVRLRDTLLPKLITEEIDLNNYV